MLDYQTVHKMITNHPDVSNHNEKGHSRTSNEYLGTVWETDTIGNVRSFLKKVNKQVGGYTRYQIRVKPRIGKNNPNRENYRNGRWHNGSPRILNYDTIYMKDAARFDLYLSEVSREKPTYYR